MKERLSAQKEEELRIKDFQSYLRKQESRDRKYQNRHDQLPASYMQRNYYENQAKQKLTQQSSKFFDQDNAQEQTLALRTEPADKPPDNNQDSTCKNGKPEQQEHSRERKDTHAADDKSPDKDEDGLLEDQANAKAHGESASPPKKAEKSAGKDKKSAGKDNKGAGKDNKGADTNKKGADKDNKGADKDKKDVDTDKKGADDAGEMGPAQGAQDAQQAKAGKRKSPSRA